MKKQPITLPKLSATMETGHLGQWLKQPGAPIKKGDALAEVESDKAVMELEAFDSGYLVGPLAESDHDYPVGAVLGYLSDEPGDTKEATPAAPPTEGGDHKSHDVGMNSDLQGTGHLSDDGAGRASARQAGTENASNPDVGINSDLQETGHLSDDGVGRASARQPRYRASQYARRLAHELGVDLSWVRPNEGDIIRSQHVIAAALRGPVPPLEAGPEWHLKPLLPIHRAVAEHMAATITTPTFRVSAHIPLQALKDSVHTRQLPLTLLLARALARSVQEHPDFNATYTPFGLAVRRRIDVGIAMDVPGGLLTPVLRDAAKRPLEDLAHDWANLKQKARDRRLQPDDYEGATIYLSNLGMFEGIDRFDAIVPLGACAILAIGATRDGTAEVTLSADHRVVFGADAARFMQTFAGYCKQPEGLA